MLCDSGSARKVPASARASASWGLAQRSLSEVGTIASGCSGNSSGASAGGAGAAAFEGGPAWAWTGILSWRVSRTECVGGASLPLGYRQGAEAHFNHARFREEDPKRGLAPTRVVEVRGPSRIGDYAGYYRSPRVSPCSSWGAHVHNTTMSFCFDPLKSHEHHPSELWALQEVRRQGRGEWRESPGNPSKAVASVAVTAGAAAAGGGGGVGG